MSDFAAAFAEAKENERQEYLPVGKATVSVRNVEIKVGDDARPAWANKSLSVMLGNDDGVTFLDIELDPLSNADGELNQVGLSIATTNLINLGCEFGDPQGVADFARQAEAFVMSGGMHGAEVEINITEKIRDKINPNTGNPYVNRRVYVNKLFTPGAGDEMAMPVASGAVDPQVI